MRCRISKTSNIPLVNFVWRQHPVIIFDQIGVPLAPGWEAFRAPKIAKMTAVIQVSTHRFVSDKQPPAFRRQKKGLISTIGGMQLGETVQPYPLDEPYMQYHEKSINLHDLPEILLIFHRNSATFRRGEWQQQERRYCTKDHVSYIFLERL